MVRFFECFDFVSNIENIFDAKPHPEHDTDLYVLSFFRTMAFFYVIYAQVNTYLPLTAKNFNYSLTEFQDQWSYLILVGGQYALDIFFFLSGFMAAFVLLSRLRKRNLRGRTYLYILLHRYLRFMPSMMVVMLIFWKISPHLGYGPLWPDYVDTA